MQPVYEWRALLFTINSRIGAAGHRLYTDGDACVLPLPFVSGQQDIDFIRMETLVFCPYHSYPGSRASSSYGWGGLCFALTIRIQGAGHRLHTNGDACI